MAYENPYILAENFINDSTTFTASEAVGFPAENVADLLDWTYWESAITGNQFFSMDMGADIDPDTVVIGGSNLWPNGSVFLLQSSNDSGYSPAETRATWSLTFPFLDQTKYISLSEFPPARYWRAFVFAGPSGGIPKITNLWLGSKITIPVGAEFSFDPDMQKIISEKYANSEGRLPSNGKRYSERMMNVEFKRISQSFVDTDLLPFLEDHYSQMLPFFFVPDPGNVFGTDKIYYLTAPENPRIELPVYNDQIGFRNWTLLAEGVRQSTFR